MSEALSGGSRQLFRALGVVLICGLSVAVEAAGPTAPHLAPVPAARPISPISIRPDIRASLNQARAAIVAARGMADQDRRVALRSIDRALVDLDCGLLPGPALR